MKFLNKEGLSHLWEKIQEYFIAAPSVASMGQTIAVSEVDENGNPTKWKAVDLPSTDGLATEEYVDETIENIPTPDWNATEGENGYIENKPEGVGYEGKEYKLVSLSTETVDDITVAERFSPNVTIVVGNKYRVTVGDNVYELVAYTDTNGFLTIGAPVASSGAGWDFSQSPVSLYNNDKGNTYFAYNTLGTYDISVEEEVDVTYKIDSNYIHTPNWSVSNGEAGHIIGRTHYTEIVDTAVLFDESVIASTPKSAIQVELPTNIVSGKKYRVIFDDVEYIVTSYEEELEGTLVLGMVYADEDHEYATQGDRIDYSVYPFALIDGEYLYCITGIHTIRISEYEEIVHRLDSKYLPEGIATETYVDEAIPAWAKEPNKPTYTATDVGADPTGSASAALSEAKTYSESQASAALSEAKTYAETKAAEVVNSAPETLNTLNELATALGNDPNFATTVANQIGTKANSSDLTSHTSNKSNPHGVTAAQLGITSETWTFTLDNGSTVTKKVAILS